MESKSSSFFSPPVSAVNHDPASGRHKWRAGEAMRRIPWSFIYSRKRRRRSRSLINNDPPRHPWAEPRHARWDPFNSAVASDES
ncbi:uncharacterized [Tachysurus ichikawai]